MSDTEDRLTGCTDAQIWAEEFVKTCRNNGIEKIALDEGAMIGWFANAIMAGVDSREDVAEQLSRTREKYVEQMKLIDELRSEKEELEGAIQQAINALETYTGDGDIGFHQSKALAVLQNAGVTTHENIQEDGSVHKPGLQ